MKANFTLTCLKSYLLSTYPVTSSESFHLTNFDFEFLVAFGSFKLVLNLFQIMLPRYERESFPYFFVLVFGS